MCQANVPKLDKLESKSIGNTQTRFKISSIELDKIIRFVGDSRHSLVSSFHASPENLAVAMPDNVYCALKLYHRESLSMVYNEHEKDFLIYGLKIFPHYKYEVVVYDKNYFEEVPVLTHEIDCNK